MLSSRHQFQVSHRVRALNALILIALAALQAFGQAKETISLYQAMREGKVVATFTGTGGSSGDSVELQVAKTSKAGGPLELTVPPGSMLYSANGAEQSMVIMGVRGRDLGGGMFSPASKIVVPSTTPVNYILSAFCAEFEKENPSPSDTFALEDPDPVLACIARNDKSLSVPAEQAAVWMYTDRMTYARVNEKFAVSQAEWSAAEGVFQRCQPSAQVPSAGITPTLGSPAPVIATAGRPRLESRDYYEFDLEKGKSPILVATVSLQLREINSQTGKFTIDVTADHRTIEKKDWTTLEPIQFYTGRDHMLYELVVSAVRQNTISGYLSTPKSPPIPVTIGTNDRPTSQQAPVTKVGLINIQQAVFASNEGQRELRALGDTATEEQRKTVSQHILSKMAPIILKFLSDNGFGVALDTSNPWPKGPVVWVDPKNDLTKSIVSLYDGGASSFLPTLDDSRMVTINIHLAIFATKEGQRDFTALSKELEPKQAELKRMNAEIENLKKQFESQGNRLSHDESADLSREIDQKQKLLKRSVQEARDDAQAQQDAIALRISNRMAPLIVKLARDSGYGAVIDTSNPWPQGSVLWAGRQIDITKAAVEAYNAQSAGAR